MSHKMLLRIQGDLSGQAQTPINPERVIKGQPLERVNNQFTNAKNNFFCGVWESSEGQWNLNYTEDEFCYMIEGQAIITDEQGCSETVNAGDAFVIPAGFTGTWQTIGHAKKFYSIYEEA